MFYLIKIVGVTTKGGIPISISTLIPIRSKELVASLVYAVRALSEVLGIGKVRRVDFGDDKLLITDTNKGYLVFSLASVAGDYVERLLLFIAAKIDSSDEIEPAREIVDNTLSKKVEKLLQRYVEPSVPISVADILVNMWVPLYEQIAVRKPTMQRIERIKRLLNLSAKRERRRWRVFMEKTEARESAIRYALNGDFNLAYLLSKDSESLINRIFSLKMGILARSIINRPAPPLEELESLADTLPEDNVYADLLRKEIEYLKQSIGVTELIEAYLEATEKFSFDYEDSLMLAFLFISPLIGVFGDFAIKLAEFFKNKSDVIYSYLIALYERQKILEKAYTITSYDEIRKYLLIWERRAKENLSRLDRIFNSNTVEDGKVLLVAIPNIITYQMLITALIESPVLMLREKMSLITLNIRMYIKYIRRILRAKLPIFVSSLIDVFQVLGATIVNLYMLLTREQALRSFVRNSRQLLLDFLAAILQEASKIRPYLEVIVTFLSGVSSCLMELNISVIEELEATFIVLDGLNVKGIDGWKFVQPYKLASFSSNLISLLMSMAIRYMDRKNKEKVLKYGLQKLIRLYKWFITQGKIASSFSYMISCFLIASWDFLGKRKVGEVMDFLDVHIHVLVPSIELGGAQLAGIGRSVIYAFLLAHQKLNVERYRELACRIFRTVIRTFNEAGLIRKADELTKRFKNFC